MHSVPIDIFFSCSFADADRDLNKFFLALCKALSLRPTNVSTGSPRTPPAEAKELIERAQAVIAVCPRRDEMANGKYVMPSAVRDEIAMAFATNTPQLMIVEDGVDASGFQPNFGTYLPFKRDDLYTPEFLEKAVEAIHEIKMFALGPNQGGASGLAESHAEYVNHLVELKTGPKGLTWHYSTIKRLVYSKASRRSFPVGVWATVPVKSEGAEKNMEWRLSLRSASRNIALEQVIEKHTPACLEARIKLNPPAEDGDFIEYLTQAESPYINPVWLEDLGESNATIHLDDGVFACADGLMFIHKTKKAIIEFRMARESRLTKSDIRPFVGSYSTAIDYEVESELRRANVRIEDFGGSITVRLEIDSPLPGHMYGIAWTPKSNPDRAFVDDKSVALTDQTEALIRNVES